MTAVMVKGDIGGDDNNGWCWGKTMMGRFGGGIGGWVGFVVATMFGGDGG